MTKDKEKKINLLCKLGFHRWVYSLREAQARNKNFVISLSSDDNVPKDLYFCSKCGRRKL